MTAREASRIRLGVAGLLLSGLLFAAGALLRGPDVMPTEPLARFVAFVTARHYTHGWYLVFAGQVFEALGFLGLYKYIAQKGAERTAFAGAMMSLVAALLIMPLFGLMAFTVPTLVHLAQAGYPQAIDAASGYMTTPVSLATMIVAGTLYCVGSILFGVAMWRSHAAPKVVAVLYALSAPLISLTPNFTAQLVGMACLIVSAAVLTIRAFSAASESAAPVTSATDPAVMG